MNPNLGLPAAQSDLATFDALRPVMQRLGRLYSRGSDTQMALGSDVMATALHGYKLLKVSGSGQSLEPLRASLATRFTKRSRSTEPKAA